MASKNGAKNGISATVRGDKLVVEVPLAPKGTVSASGKSRIIATTGGNVEVVLNGEVAKVGVNAYVKNAR